MSAWEKQFYYVDKSTLIKSFVKLHHKVILISCPQSFMKTSNVRMLNQFLSIPTDSKVRDTRMQLFKNFKVMWNPSFVEKHFGRHPTILLSFSQNESYSIKRMVDVFRQLFAQFEFLLESPKLTNDDKILFHAYLKYDSKDLGTSEVKLVDALSTLCILLRKHHEKLVYVFIDNYDAPIFESINNNRPIYNFLPFYERILTSVCTSESVQCVLLTGISSILRFGNEEIVEFKFLHDHVFSEYFGFTEGDVDEMAVKCSREVLEFMKKRHYTTISNKKIYSPEWILNYLNYSRVEEGFWYETMFTRPVYHSTAMNNRIQSLLDGMSVKFNVRKFKPSKDVWLLNRLLNGSVEDEIDESEIDLLLSMLLEFGMLTFVDKERRMSLSCLPSQQKTKFILSNTSRGCRCLRNLFHQ